MAACPQAHWLEYQEWAAPILQRPLELKDGFALPRTEAGWNDRTLPLSRPTLSCHSPSSGTRLPGNINDNFHFFRQL
jgi:hypothetical protein